MIKSPKEIRDPELKRELLELLSTIADSELAMVELFAPWLVNAQTVDARLFTARLVADELNHAWQFVRVIEDFGEEGQNIIKGIKDLRLGLHKIETFNLPLFTWEDAVSFVFIIDRFNLNMLKALIQSKFEPLSTMSRNIIKEEEYHISYSENEIRRLVNENRIRIQGSINFWFPRLLDIFSQFRSFKFTKIFSLNIYPWFNEDNERKLIEEISKKIESFGLEVIDVNRFRKYLT